MKNKNLELWDKVQKTDVKFTKTEFAGGRNVTSITPMYQIKNATEVFGIYGLDWGVVPESVSFTEREIDQTILLNYNAILFYTINDREGRLPIQATEKLSYMTKNGKQLIDHEARKKVATNALTKGLSMLGFNADIFMGMFEDKDYVNTIATEQAIEDAEDQDAAIQLKKDELAEYVKRNISAIKNANSLNEAGGIHKVSVIHLQRQSNIPFLKEWADKGVTAIAREFEKKQQELKEND